jgi:hypothetical protein
VIPLVVRRSALAPSSCDPPPPTLDAALRPLVADTVRAAVVERVRAAGLADTEPHLAALAAAGADLGADPAAWMASRSASRAAPPSRSGPSPPPPPTSSPGSASAHPTTPPRPRAATGSAGSSRRGAATRTTTSRPSPSPSPPGRTSLGARSSRTAPGPSWPSTQGSIHHALLDRWRDLPKNRRRPYKTTQRDGWAEILHPEQAARPAPRRPRAARADRPRDQGLAIVAGAPTLGRAAMPLHRGRPHGAHPLVARETTSTRSATLTARGAPPSCVRRSPRRSRP